MTASSDTPHPLTALLHDPAVQDDPRIETLVRNLAFHHAYHSIVRGLLHRANNHLQGVHYGVPFLTGEETTDPPSLDRLRELVGNGAAGTLEAVEHLSALMAVRSRNRRPTASTEVVTRSVAWAAYHRHATAIRITIDDQGSAPAINAPFSDAACSLALVLNNAIESPTSDPSAVRVSLSHTGTEVTFSVRDSGTGPRGKQPALLFGVGRSDKEGHEGLGLPLAVWLTERHGGTVTLGTDNAEGAFRITFPAAGTTPDS